MAIPVDWPKTWNETTKQFDAAATDDRLVLMTRGLTHHDTWKGIGHLYRKDQTPQFSDWGGKQLCIERITMTLAEYESYLNSDVLDKRISFDQIAGLLSSESLAALQVEGAFDNIDDATGDVQLALGTWTIENDPDHPDHQTPPAPPPDAAAVTQVQVDTAATTHFDQVATDDIDTYNANPGTWPGRRGLGEFDTAARFTTYNDALTTAGVPA